MNDYQTRLQERGRDLTTELYFAILTMIVGAILAIVQWFGQWFGNNFLPDNIQNWFASGFPRAMAPVMAYLSIKLPEITFQIKEISKIRGIIKNFERDLADIDAPEPNNY